MKPAAKLALFAVIVVSASTPPVGCAFDIHTHAAMTSEAVAQSAFSRTPQASVLLRSLGLTDVPSAVSTTYVDVGSSLVSRQLLSFELGVFDELNKNLDIFTPSHLSVTGWMMRGSIREDDNEVETPGSDEPGGKFNRVFGHFFDPVNNVGLHFLVSRGDRAVDWAILPSARAHSRENHFDVTDAREAMWRALTLKAKDSTGGFNDNVEPTNWPHSREELRKAYWGTTFRALGDVVHLLQDMAQPQHTRNDMHSGLGCTGLGCLLGHDSFFEKYMKARTLKKRLFSLDEAFLPPAPPGPPVTTHTPPLTYTGYLKPTFNSFADYFATATSSGNASGKGLANYSNRGFYSAGTNVKSLTNFYDSPPASGQGLGSSTVIDPVNMAGRALQGSITFRTGQVSDTLTGAAEANVKLSSYGLWDQFLQEKNVLLSSYTLNYFNYDDQARLLVPRAVAYSAGLIDYFFRGQLEISLPKAGVYAFVDHSTFTNTDAVNGFSGFDKVTLRVRNATPSISAPDGITYPQDMGAGYLVAVVKFHRNKCYQDDLSGEKGGPGFSDVETCRSTNEEIVVSRLQSVFSVGTTPTEYDFIFDQQIPINATDVYLQVVFRGLLGSEQDAVAVGTKDISEPTYQGFLNATDYILIDHEVWKRDEVASTQRLLDKVQPRSCVINNNQLRDTCFLPKTVSFWLAFPGPGPSDPSGLQVWATDVPSKRYSRFAILIDVGAPRVATRQDTCDLVGRDLPYGPFQAQVSIDAQGFEWSDYSSLHKIRGAYVWSLPSCVLNGDGVGAIGDNRDAVMNNLDDLRPYASTFTTPPPP